MLTERRSLKLHDFRVNRTVGDTRILAGHAALFNSLSQDLGGFIEKVDPLAFSETLSKNPDVWALINHDSNLILARTAAGTLRLKVDRLGLAVEIDVAETTYGNDLLVSIDRKDLDQMSFGFRVIEDTWEFPAGSLPVRTLKKIDLEQGDVSPVVYPAYLATDVGIV